MALNYLKPNSIAEAQDGSPEGWDHPSNPVAYTKINDVYGLWDDTTACSCIWTNNTGPHNGSRLRFTFESLPPVFSIQNVTLYLRIYRASASYNGQDFRPFLWIAGTPYYVTPSTWLTPAQEAALDNLDGTVRAPFGSPSTGTNATEFFVPYLINPATGVPWQRPDINAMTGGVLARNTNVVDGEGPFLCTATLIVNAIGAPDQKDQVSDVGSRYVWEHRRVLRTVSNLPVRQSVGYSVKPMDVLQVAHFAGPHENGHGWGVRADQLRGFQIRSYQPRDDGTVIIGGVERRETRVLYYDSMILKDNVSPATEDGALRINKGNTRTYTRTGNAYVRDPGSGLFTLAEANEKTYGLDGFECFEGYRNDMLYSAFQGGNLTNWAKSGTGTNGSAINADATDAGAATGETVGWDAATTAVAQSVLFTAGSPHTADLKLTSSAWATYAGGTVIAASVWYTQYAANQPIYMAIQRQVDSKYYNPATQTWGASVVWIDVTNPALQGTVTGTQGDQQGWHLGGINVGASATPVILIIALPTGLTPAVAAGQISRVYAAQVASATGNSFYLTGAPPMLTTSAGTIRSGALYTVSNNSGKRFFNAAQGALSARVVPAWLDTNQPTTSRVITQVVHDGSNYAALFWTNDSSTGVPIGFSGWVARIVGAGVITDVRISTAALGVKPLVPLRLVMRWTGANAELGLTANTLSLFLIGQDGAGGGAAHIIQGTNAVYTSMVEQTTSTAYIGSSSTGVFLFGGWISRLTSLQWVPTAAEVSRLSV